MAPPGKRSSKELEILERQRLMAARLSSAQQSADVSSSSSKPPVVNPYARSTQRSSQSSSQSSSSMHTKKSAPSPKRKSSSMSIEQFLLPNPRSSKASPSHKPIPPVEPKVKPKPPPLPSTSTTQRPTLKRPSRKRANASSTKPPPPSEPIRTTSVTSAIAASRARLGMKQKELASQKTIRGSGSGSSSSITGSSTGGGLSALLQSAGVTSSDLKTKSSTLSNAWNENEDRFGTSHVGMDDYFLNLREWDFITIWNEANRKGGGGGGKGNKGNKRSRDGNKDQTSSSSSSPATPPLVQPKPIPDTFVSREEYQKRWAPLCLSESRAQLLSDASGEVPYWNKQQSSGNGKRSSSSSGGPIAVVAKARSKDVGKDSNSMTLVVNLAPAGPDEFGKSNSPSFMQNDVVVLARTKGVFQMASRGKLEHSCGKKDCLSFIPRSETTSASGGGAGSVTSLWCMVGHVEYGRRSLENLQVVVSRDRWVRTCSSISRSGGGGTKKTIITQSSSGSGKAATIGGQGEPLVLLKLGGNVTAMREFSALCRAGSTPLLQDLLGKKLEKKGHSKMRKSTSSGSLSSVDSACKWTEERMEKTEMLKKMGGTAALGAGFTKYATNLFNPSQLGAISAASTEYGEGGFTLIKGPPGTGKTTTLVALLNALHIRQFNQYFEKVRAIVIAGTTSTGAKKLALAKAAKGKPRLLVCAPSNNAVDNIIHKIFKSGFIDGHGRKYNPSLVRVGRGASDSVKHVSLEHKVNNLLDDAKNLPKLEQAINGFKAEISRIHRDITRLRRRIAALEGASPWPLVKDWEIRVDSSCEENLRVYFVNHKEKITTYECPPPPEPDEKHFPARSMPEHRSFTGQLVKLVDRYTNINSKLERTTMIQGQSSNLTSGKRDQSMESIRQQLETHTLDSTHIVLTTLGTAGARSLESCAKFEVVVVDEAAQSVEPASLVALQLGSSHAILVGDPQQLPATIFSVSGRNTKYDRSLFGRLEDAGHKVHLLDTQYRMHPKISDFPRRIFYGGYLKDGNCVKRADWGNPMRKKILSKFPAFHPFTIFDIDSKEERGGTSMSNSTEAHFALHLYTSLVHGELGQDVNKTKVSIITPYSQQAAVLRRVFSQSIGSDYTNRVEVNTVDAFQGRESNIVIFSCVRAAGSRGIGFLSDVRRMNVALTRAKFFLFVIARCESIVMNPYWADLVSHAKDAGSVIRVPVNRQKQTFAELASLETVQPEAKPIMPSSKRTKKDTSRDGDKIHEDNTEDGEVS